MALVGPMYRAGAISSALTEKTVSTNSGTVVLVVYALTIPSTTHAEAVSVALSVDASIVYTRAVSMVWVVDAPTIHGGPTRWLWWWMPLKLTRGVNSMV